MVDFLHPEHISETSGHYDSIALSLDIISDTTKVGGLLVLCVSHPIFQTVGCQQFRKKHDLLDFHIPNRISETPDRYKSIATALDISFGTIKASGLLVVWTSQPISQNVGCQQYRNPSN